MVRNKQDENMANNGGDAEEKPVSAKVLHHVMEPTHLGEMDKPDGHAVITGPCGDTDEFFLRIFSSRIREIRFRTTGCFFTIAACDAVYLSKIVPETHGRDIKTISIIIIISCLLRKEDMTGSIVANDNAGCR